MRHIQQRLITFFNDVAKKDKLLLKEIQKEDNFNVEQTRWCFTLPNLYSFLYQHDDIFNQIEYKQFRKLIYSSPINKAVKSHNAEIIIADNRTKVDKSIYAVVWKKNNSPIKQTDTLKFIHITDTHLLNDAEEIFHEQNTKNNLEKVLSHSQKQYPDAGFILFTGDISQTGTKESYSLFKSIIEKYHLPVYCIPGNHDAPKHLQQIIPNCPDDSIKIIKYDEFSLVLLNSHVKNQHHGIISQACLQQLKEHLQNNQEQYNIIAIHHPPVLINSKWLDDFGLKNKDDFLQIINEYSNNTLLICGHVHQEIDRQLDKLRLLATPSTCHQFKVNADQRVHIDIPAPAYRFVNLGLTNNIYTKVHYIK